MKTCGKFAVALTFFINFHLSHAKNYDDYCLYNLYPDSVNKQKLLANMHEKKHFDIIFPEMPPENYFVQVLVNITVELDFLTRMKHYEIDINRLSNNVQQVFDDQLSKGPAHSRRTMRETVRSLSEIYAWLNDTAAKYPYTKLESIGKSIENRDIFSFSIKIPPMPNYNNLKAIIEGAIHGNEWISAAATLHMIESVLNATSGPYEVLKKKYFLYFIPVLNPDGYEYSQKEDPLWKKNRRKTGVDTYGVNLNRNFAYKFGEHDSSTVLASDKYRGAYPFSEPETFALKEYIYRKRNQIAFYFSLHGLGQKLILPYSDSTKHVVNFHEVHSVANNALAKMTNGQYDVGIAAEILGKQYSGDSASWVKKTYHVPYTITIKLRDRGEYGIALPNSEIEKTCAEISNGLTTLMVSTGQYRSYDNNTAIKRVHNSFVITSHFLVFLILIK